MNNKKQSKLTQSKFTKKYTLVFLLIALAFILSFSLGTVSAADWSVGPGGTHNYTSIQDAINNESTLSGDTISVYDNGTPYTYNENVVVNKTNLTVRSAGQVTVSGSSNPANPVFTINNQGTYAYITGFILSGATNSAGVLVSETNDVTLNNLTINNCQQGVILAGTSTNITINNTIITQPGQQGIFLGGSLTNLTIDNTQIINPQSHGIEKYYYSNLDGIFINNTIITEPQGHGINLIDYSYQGLHLRNVLINNTTINQATSDGIYINMGTGTSGNVTINNTTSNNNIGTGLFATTRGNVSITNNTFQNNGNWGIWVNGQNDPTFTFNNNTVENNGNGVYLQNIHNLIIDNTNNNIRDNGGIIYLLENSDNTTITNINFNNNIRNYNAAISANNCDNLNLNNLNITQSTEQAIIVGGTATNIIINQINITQPGQQGIHLGGSLTNITINQINITQPSQQGIYLAPGSLTNLTIDNTQIINPQKHGIEKNYYGNLDGIFINNTIITEPLGHGINLIDYDYQGLYLRNVFINNSTINQATSDGIYINMGTTSSGNVTITNTVINNIAGSGVYATTRGNVTIINNSFQNNGGWGVWVNGQNDPTFTFNNNTIKNNGNGLLLQSINEGIFQDNQLINNTGDDLYATGDTNNTFTRLTLGVAHPTTVSFDYINGIIMNGVESPPVDPSGLFNIGKYVDMQGLGSTNVNLKVHYNDSDVVNLNETSLKNFHFNNSWSELPQPNGVNTTERYVYANEISSFSTFAPLGEKPSTMLAVTDVSGLNGQTVNLEATLTNQDGTPLAGKTIDFTVNGTFVGSAVTDDDGIATFSYLITLTPDTYAINATFNGDGGYTATDATSTLTVYKNSTSTVVTDVTGVNGQSVQLQATLTNQDGTPLAGKTIDFTVNGTSVGSALTDDDGIATFSYLITLTPDTYAINATFAGDSNYNNTYNTGIMTVYKNATSLAVANVTGTNGQNVNLQAKLTNQDGTPLAGKNIQFTVNGANIGSATTGTNGVAILAYTITQTSNTYTIGSIFTEDGNYNGTTGSGTLTVDLKPTAKANIKGGLFNVNKNVYLSMNKPGTIYYTRNGSTPTKASTKYTGYLTISSTTTLRFIGVDLGGNVSPVYTERYVIDKTAPKVTYTYPRNLRTGQSRTATLYLKFSEKIKTSTNWSKIYVKDLKTGKKVSISKWIKGNILYIKTKYKRASLRSYQVYVPYKAVKDFAGNNLVRTYSYKFKTRR